MTTRRGLSSTPILWKDRSAARLRVQAENARRRGLRQVSVPLSDRSGRRLQRLVGIALGVFADSGYRLVSQNQIYDNQPVKLAYYRATLVFELGPGASCASCGAPLVAPAKFCTVCGTAV